MSHEPKRAIAVVGPTASGKTALAITLAECLSGEIVSCDSMQIYRGMDIGTAKATAAEQARVPHHLIDVVDPDQSYSAADYAAAASTAVSDIVGRGRVPIFCGGTGLYLEAARTGRHRGLPPVPPDVRDTLARMAGEQGAAAMHARLAEVDPLAASAIHPHNLVRVLRALEIYEATGKPKSVWDAESAARPPELSLLVLFLHPEDRAALRDTIDRRVASMVARGLRDEVAGLLVRGYLRPPATAASAIGYKEYVHALEGKITEDEAIEEIKLATHRYARRQLTWFRAIPSAVWLPFGKEGLREDTREAARASIQAFLQGTG